MEGGPSIQEADYNSDYENYVNDLHERSEYSACCDPRSCLHRFIALFFMCWLGFGK